MSECPCGSGQAFDQCCEPIIKGERQADTAEALMRARYSAHTLPNIDFIVRTHHPATRNEIDSAATERWARDSDWIDFRIIGTEGGGEDDDRGQIEFVAHYRDPHGERQTHHELSRFEKHHGQWFFRSAEMPEVGQVRREGPKVGRNDPCPCGSGKKYKKCCGQTA